MVDLSVYTNHRMGDMYVLCIVTFGPKLFVRWCWCWLTSINYKQVTSNRTRCTVISISSQIIYYILYSIGDGDAIQTPN